MRFYIFRTSIAISQLMSVLKRHAVIVAIHANYSDVETTCIFGSYQVVCTQCSERVIRPQQRSVFIWGSVQIIHSIRTVSGHKGCINYWFKSRNIHEGKCQRYPSVREREREMHNVLPEDKSYVMSKGQFMSAHLQEWMLRAKRLLKLLKHPEEPEMLCIFLSCFRTKYYFD